MQKEKIEEKTEKPSWIKTRPEELEKIIIELAAQDTTPAKIGIVLRDKYAIPKTRLLGKKITQILKDKKIKYVKESDIIAKRIEKIKTHMIRHKHDYTAKKSLAEKLWLQYRLAKVQ